MPVVVDEDEKVRDWQLRMLMVEGGVEYSLALALILARADYRQVIKAVEGGADPEQVERIFL